MISEDQLLRNLCPVRIKQPIILIITELGHNENQAANHYNYYGTWPQ